MSLVSLQDIPALFVGDPQSGLKAILQHMPGGSIMTKPTDVSRTWVLEMRVPSGGLIANVVYEEPLVILSETQGDWDARKTRSISKFLTEVANSARVWLGSGVVIPDPVAPAPPTVKQILQAAKVRPELSPVRGSKEDALLAKLLTRRVPV